MALRGDRFHVDFSSDEEDVKSPGPDQKRAQQTMPSPFNFIADVKEREPKSSPQAPTLPTPKTSSTTGFPAHRKRTRVSAFKQQKTGQTEDTDSSSERTKSNVASSALENKRDHAEPTSTKSDETAITKSDRQRINEENEQRLASMSRSEIEQERQELLSGLSPSLVERLLRKANIDDDDPERSRAQAESRSSETKETKKVTFADPQPSTPQVAIEPQQKHEPHTAATQTASISTPFITTSSSQPQPDPDAPPLHPPPDLHPASTKHPPLLHQPKLHFPNPPAPPSLNPSSPDFLSQLHTHYFPSLPSSPQSQAWMAPLPTDASPADLASPYSPSQPSLAPSALRFAFTGALLPPTLSRSIPVTEGLHHHGQAPEAAGYTVPELALLARSTVASQRCVAYQTLGRVLFRLGRGEWGGEGDELVMGLWRCVEEGKVVEVMTREAKTEGGGGHVSARAYAVEALWNWQRGGGRKWKAQ